MGVPVCEVVYRTRILAKAQGLPAELVNCPRAPTCDLKEPCVTSRVDVFNARLERTAALNNGHRIPATRLEPTDEQRLESVRQRLEDIKVSAQFYANGDKI
jgi:hypothetical protein